MRCTTRTASPNTVSLLAGISVGCLLLGSVEASATPYNGVHPESRREKEDNRGDKWRITLDEKDITTFAHPEEQGGVLWVNGYIILAQLGLPVQVENHRIRITDAQGTQWEAENGESVLTAPGEVIILPGPLSIEGNLAIRLPLTVVARLAGRSFQQNGFTRIALLKPLGEEASPETPAAPTDKDRDKDKDSDTDWKPIQLAKETTALTAAAVASNQITTQPSALKVNLPPTRDRIRMGLGVGYVQGADFGLEWTAFGRAAGSSLALSALVTQGDRGLRVQGGRLSVLEPSGKFRFEAGDLLSDLWGLSRGIRVVQQGQRGRSFGLSLYFRDGRTVVPRPMLQYQAELPLSRNFLVGGEATSDNSLFFKTRFSTSHQQWAGYVRRASVRNMSGEGVFFSQGLGAGLIFFGGASRTGQGTDRTQWESMALRLPLPGNRSLTLERTRNTTASAESLLHSAYMTTPVGPLRLLLRYQQGDLSLFRTLSGLRVATRDQRQEVSLAAAYYSRPGISMDYQMSLFWQPNGQQDSFRQLLTTIPLARGTRLNVTTAVPDLLAPDLFRVRLLRDLRPDLALSLDYGLLTPYQGGTTPTDRGVMFMLRKQWNVPTPPSGAEVSGLVRDAAGRGLKGVRVLLGEYAALTDGQGKYRFRYVPEGDYPLRVDTDSLPVDYRVAGETEQKKLASRDRIRQDFTVVPLFAITGRVFYDKNRNGIADAGEGMGRVVIRCQNEVTATETDGQFAFYNLSPGTYRIILDTARLPQGYAPTGQTETEVELTPRGAGKEILFRIAPQEKHIEFQSLPTMQDGK